MKKLSIKKAIKRPGALTKKAKSAGLTLTQYANKHKKDKGLTGQQSRFYLTLRDIAKKRKQK